jgi:hypothetical protein
MECSCLGCKEDVFEFLTIDHINGGGGRHRAEVGSGNRFYRWLIKNGFPEGFRTLCYNCNNGIRITGDVCPHERQASER